MKKRTIGRAEAAAAECFSSIRAMPCVMRLECYGSPLPEDWYHPPSESHVADLRTFARTSRIGKTSFLEIEVKPVCKSCWMVTVSLIDVFI